MSSPLSAFTAVPNPQMLAFMGAQSFIMMMQAGEGWQYGKRKQSAMTNEEFNKQTPLSIMQRQMSELKQAIPTIEEAMNSMTPMVRTIVIQYGAFMAEIIKAIPETLTQAQGGQTLSGNISTVGKEFKEILENININFNLPKGFIGLPEAHAEETPTIIETPTTDNAEIERLNLLATNEKEFQARLREKERLAANAKLQAEKAAKTLQLSSGQRATVTGTADRAVITFEYGTWRKKIYSGKPSMIFVAMKKQTYVGNANFMRRKLVQLKNSWEQLKDPAQKRTALALYTALLQASIKAFGASPFAGV